MSRLDLSVSALALLVPLLVAPSARADDRFTDLELTVPIALADRSTTGTDDALLGFGYDAQSGLLTGLEARLYYELNRYIQLGPMIAGAHHAGPLLGAVDGYALRSTYMDAGLAARALFPCMSGGDRRVHLSGVLAVSGVHADAGLGVGGADNGPRYAERVAASERLDHAGVGWRLALDLSVHLGSFVLGGGVGLRQHFGVDSPVARDLQMEVGLRIGGRIDLPAPREPDPWMES